MCGMFDSVSKKNSSQFETAGAKPPAGLESVVVHSIPVEFYNGGVGDGVLHGPLQKIVPRKETESASSKIEAATPVSLPRTEKDSTLLKVGASPAKVSGAARRSSFRLLLGVLVLGVTGVVYYFMSSPKATPTAPLAVESPVVEIVTSSPEVAVEESVTTSTPYSEVLPSPAVYPKGLREYILAPDADFDELSDTEEQTIFGTQAQKPDSDDDGYVDGHEVLNLYHPGGFKPVKLIDTSLVVKYSNAVFGYEALTPSRWLVGPLDEDGTEVLFTAETGEYVAIKVYPNLTTLSFKEWYTTLVPQAPADGVQEFATKQGLHGFKSPDGLAVYFLRNNVVYEIRYDLGARGDANFMRTFAMMQQSFVFTTNPRYVPPQEVAPITPHATPTSPESTETSSVSTPQPPSTPVEVSEILESTTSTSL